MRTFLFITLCAITFSSLTACRGPRHLPHPPAPRAAPIPVPVPVPVKPSLDLEQQYF